MGVLHQIFSVKSLRSQFPPYSRWQVPPPCRGCVPAQTQRRSQVGAIPALPARNGRRRQDGRRSTGCACWRVMISLLLSLWIRTHSIGPAQSPMRVKFAFSCEILFFCRFFRCPCIEFYLFQLTEKSKIVCIFYFFSYWITNLNLITILNFAHRLM